METINLEKYNKVKSEIKAERDKAWKVLDDIRSKETELQRSLINLERKYLKITDLGTVKYLYVTEQFETTHYDGPAILIRGLGFNGLITTHQDSTYFEWDEYMEHYVRLNNMFEEDMSNISEITREEFNKAFDNIISKVIREHYTFLKNE